MNYQVVYTDPSYSNNILETMINQCRTPDDVQGLIERNLFTIERLEMPCGFLRKEHIEKAVQIVQYFGTPQVLPEIPLLRKLCMQVIPSKGKEVQISNKEVVEFYKYTYSDLNLSNTQWNRIADKLSLEDFLSIDRMAERAVLVWNSIPGIHTSNSCTGHSDALRYFCFSNVNMTYDHSRIEKSLLNNSLNEHFNDLNSDRMKTDITISDSRIDVMFFQVPSKHWITKHNSISVEILTQKCYGQLFSIFNTEHELDDFEHQKKISNVYAADFIRRKFYKYINKLNIVLEIDDDEDESFWKIFRKRCLVFEETYKEYYLSRDAIENINKFWERCEAAGRKILSIVS